MGRITSFSKQVIVLFLTFTLFFNSAFASTSNPSIGGWQVVSNIAQGVGAKITATKEVVINGVSKTVSSTANITPKPSNVAKFMAKAAGVAVVTTALDYLLDGVDYVMDPANNTISYKTKPTVITSDGFTDNNGKYTADYQYYYTASGKTFTGYGAVTVCSMYYSWWNTQQTYYSYTVTGLKSGTTTTCTGKQKTISDGITTSADFTIQRTLNPNKTANPPDQGSQPRSIPMSNLASDVVSKAEKDIKAGNPASPAVALSRAAAQDMIQEAETDDVKARPIAQQLENTQAFPTTETAEGTVTNPSVTDPVTGEVKPVPPSNIALDFPVFCGWAPSVCVAADVIVKAPAQISEYIESVKQEYLKEKELNTDTELDIPDPTPPHINTDISFGGSCPAPLSAPYSFFGLSGAIEFSFDPVCQIASFIKPVVISVAAFSSVLIVAGIRTEDD